MPQTFPPTIPPLPAPHRPADLTSAHLGYRVTLDVPAAITTYPPITLTGVLSGISHSHHHDGVRTEISIDGEIVGLLLPADTTITFTGLPQPPIVYT
jgi:hypothetical protein